MCDGRTEVRDGDGRHVRQDLACQEEPRDELQHQELLQCVPSPPPTKWPQHSGHLATVLDEWLPLEKWYSALASSIRARQNDRDVQEQWLVATRLVYGKSSLMHEHRMVLCHGSYHSTGRSP